MTNKISTIPHIRNLVNWETIITTDNSFNKSMMSTSRKNHRYYCYNKKIRKYTR